MNAQMVWHFLKAVQHYFSMDCIPESLVKNSHIPGLGLEVVMPEASKNSEENNISAN